MVAVQSPQSTVHSPQSIPSEDWRLKTKESGLKNLDSELGAGNGNGNGFATLAELEKQHILAALDRCKGNRTHAAKMLEISIRTLRNKLHEYNGDPAVRDMETAE